MIHKIWEIQEPQVLGGVGAAPQPFHQKETDRHADAFHRGAAAVSESTAILRGLAPDGGLYVPQTFPHFSLDEIAALPRLTIRRVR
ncbi:MAG: hypothetical protein ACLR07_00980 [Christensenellales bacterium]